MDELKKLKCEACRVGAPQVTDAEIAHFHPQVSDWKLVERENIPRLERVFVFQNFVDALGFTNRVGELAEEAGHHPALLTEWGRVTVTWWTHKIKGLHRNDFISAYGTDRIYDKKAGS